MASAELLEILKNQAAIDAWNNAQRVGGFMQQSPKSILESLQQQEWQKIAGETASKIASGASAPSGVASAAAKAAPTAASAFGGAFEEAPIIQLLTKLQGMGGGTLKAPPALTGMSKVGASAGVGLLSELLGHQSLPERVGLGGLALAFGPAAQAGGLAVGELAKMLGEQTSGTGADYGTQAYLAYHPSGEALRTQRKGGPAAKIPALEQYTANQAQPQAAPAGAPQAAGAPGAAGATPTMSPVALQQSADVQKHEALMSKLMNINADIESQDWSPYAKQMARGAMSKGLMNAGFQDPMLLGMWVQHGSDAFEKLRAIQEQNKKQSSGMSFPQRVGLQAGTQAYQRNKQKEADDAAMLQAFVSGSKTKGVDVVKMAQDLGYGDAIKNNEFWKKFVPFTGKPTVDLNLLASRIHAGHKPEDIVKAVLEAKNMAEQISGTLGTTGQDQEKLDAVLNQ